ncbi:sulfatase-like hydrolase/transferase [Lichenifustis flavocetrariae]|uniref:Sulfatase-like hydrolase/transferase n=1 Tax=Lichenifustis flavocetrariae TaxID=2949735 RepID=A0AA41Z056_9HYPH|nr:sulfatase-like hydrolase/transferase [Lichenifustis flavocetrariae]MCW6510432.1 sulfatase-like hydrolase/transferase [Lichenifustis flavocetrariae]
MTRRRPNILLITVDQWRGDLLGAAGHPFARTPHLDAFAAEATRFASHYCQAYPCGPARAGLVTGLYAHKHRSIGNGVPLDARHPTLFTELRRAGYRPTLFGYTDTTLDPRGKPDLDPDNGDYENVCPGMAVDTLLTERATPWLAHLKRKGHAVATPDLGRAGIFAERAFGAPAAFAKQDSETAFLTDRFLDWLTVASTTPFCAHLSFIAPHPPFAAAAPYHAAIDPADVAMPVRGARPEVEAAQNPLVGALMDGMEMAAFAPGLRGCSRDADEDTIRRVRAIYAGLALEVDHHLGRVFQGLRDSGRWDETIVVFTADHGEQLFDHWMLGKAGYFDQSAHIPLLIRDPRPEANLGRGRTVTAFTESIDLMPTLLACAGLHAPRNCDGASLLPFLNGGTPTDWRDEVHWSFDFRDIRNKRMERLLGLPSEWCNLQVVRTERLKYVHFAGLPPVLFDLSDDPLELRNRAADSAASRLLLEGLDRLQTWRQRHEERTLTGFLSRDGILHRDPD